MFRIAPFLTAFCLAAAWPSAALAVPPLKTANVPTAPAGVAEVFLGAQYDDSGAIKRELPFAELVLGVSDIQEVTLEVPYLVVSAPGEPTRSGPGDAIVGTKFLLRRLEPERLGIALSLEYKLANGDETRGLGSGAEDVGARLRLERSWGSFTGLWNVGYTWVGEPKIEGERQERDNVAFLAFAQEYRVGERAWMLSEVYGSNSEVPGEPNRVAASVGFKHDLRPGFQIHAAAGKSLRAGNEGGPRLRLYAGIKLEFPYL